MNGDGSDREHECRKSNTRRVSKTETLRYLLGNESMLFHEALHGISGLDDIAIMAKLGFKNSQGPSCNISLKIEGLVLSQSAGLDPSTTTTACRPVE